MNKLEANHHRVPLPLRRQDEDSRMPSKKMQ